MGRWTIAGHDVDVEQCWLVFWYLWCSENIKEYLRCDWDGRSSSLTSEVEYEGWVHWQRGGESLTPNSPYECSSRGPVVNDWIIDLCRRMAYQFVPHLPTGKKLVSLQVEFLSWGEPPIQLGGPAGRVESKVVVGRVKLKLMVPTQIKPNWFVIE